MRLKLTRLLPVALSLLCLSAANSQPAIAFPFFHRKPPAEQTNQAADPPVPDSKETDPVPATPAFRPYIPSFRPYNPASPQAPLKKQSSTLPPGAPAFEGGQSVMPATGQAGASQTIIHNPPALPERPPIPPPPVVQAPLMVISGDPTAPLSWRAVAYKLWITPESLPPKRARSQSSFPYSSSITMKALIKALTEAGWTIPQFSPSAGHLLAAKPDSEPATIKLIFAAHPTDGGTVVRAATEPDSKNFDKNQIESIFSRAQEIAARKDLL